jgi:hypothetical protein
VRRGEKRRGMHLEFWWENLMEKILLETRNRRRGNNIKIDLH